MLLKRALAALLALAAFPCHAIDPVVATHAVLRDAIEHNAARAKPPSLAREVFLRRPAIDQVRLSPDGRLLALLKHDAQHDEVLLQDVASGTRTRVIGDAHGVETAWSGDGRRLWIADDAGLAVLDSATRATKRILEWDKRRAQRFWRVDARAAAYAVIQEQVPISAAAARYRYLLIDATGKTRLLHEAEWPLLDVLLTADGTLAFVVAYDGPRYDTVIRQFTAAGARELQRCTGVEVCRLVGYADAQQTLWVLSQHGEDTLALQRWQAKSARWETVRRDPAGIADADALLWSAAREDWLGIAYYRDRRRWYGHTAGDTTLLAALAQQLPDSSLQLSSSADGRLWLVRAQAANWPVARHFLYEPHGDRLRPLFERDDAAVRAAPAEPLAAAQPVSWRARDGMLLHGYVYLPRGVAPANVPLIAWVHGGPIARNYDEYEPAVQLLVNRGYAVFLPNFRASSGYGLRYMRAAQGDVGNGRVLTDILDGLDDLLELGIGDRDRQAVMGHSFGGYASLLAASHYPNRFRFAFAGAAPTDYGWVKQWQAGHESESLRGTGPPVALSFRQHGFPFDDVAWRRKMQRESPLAALSGVRVPIYLWAGAKDDRVPIKSIVHYAGEARRQDKSLSLLIDPDAGHMPAQPLGLDAWLFLIESAAHRSFGGGVTPPSPELEAFLRAHWRIDDRHASIGTQGAP